MLSIKHSRVDRVVVMVSRNLYAIGSYGVVGYLERVGRYDSVDNSRNYLPSISTPRTKFVVVVINDEIFVVLSTVEVYDPSTDTWKNCESMNERGNCVATAVLGNCVYVFGGQQGSHKLSTAERYDPITNTWVLIQDTTIPIDEYEAVANISAILAVSCYIAWLEQEKEMEKLIYSKSVRASEMLIAVGGADNEQAHSIEYYDPDANEWRIIDSIDLDVDRLFYRVVLFERKLILIGGRNDQGSVSTVESYDITTGDLETIPSMNQARDDCAAVIIRQNLYVIGGYSGNPLTSFEMYSFITGEWVDLSPMSTPRTKCAAVVLNGEIFVVGGDNCGEPLSSMEAYNPTTGTWRECSPMNENRQGISATLFGDNIFVFGGWNGSDYLTVAEKYDPILDTWTLLADASLDRYLCETIAFNEIIVVAGGFSSGALSLVETYNPVDNQWSTIAPLTLPRVYFGLLVVSPDLINNNN